MNKAENKKCWRQRHEDPKLYLQNSIDFWDPTSKGGDETQITHLTTFLEHDTKSKNT